MGIGGLGMWEVLLILVVVLLVFGAKRLPEIGSAMGKGIREFKRSVTEIEGEINRPADDDRGSIAPRSSSEPGPESSEGRRVEGGGGRDAGEEAPRDGR